MTFDLSLSWKWRKEILGTLSEKYLVKLYKVYQADFIVFNYTIDNFLDEAKKYSKTAF